MLRRHDLEQLLSTNGVRENTEVLIRAIERLGDAIKNRPGYVDYIATFREYLMPQERTWFGAVIKRPKGYGKPGSVPETERLAELAETVCRRVLADKHWRHRRDKLPARRLS
jgi:hypothetical protein